MSTRGHAARQDHEFVALPEHSAGHLARVAAVVVVLRALRAHDPLHGEAHVDEVAVRGDVHRLEVVQERRALVPGRVGAALDHVVAVQGAHRDEAQVLHVEARRHAAHFGLDPAVDSLVPAHEVHLVDGVDQVGDAQQRGDQRVAPRLFDHALARVHQHDG
jgi:hypothetical protein